jgi:hypothetical protein
MDVAVSEQREESFGVAVAIGKAIIVMVNLVVVAHCPVPGVKV